MAIVLVQITGRLSMAGGALYNAGEVAGFEEDLATELLVGGLATKVDPPKSDLPNAPPADRMIKQAPKVKGVAPTPDVKSTEEDVKP